MQASNLVLRAGEPGLGAPSPARPTPTPSPARPHPLCSRSLSLTAAFCSGLRSGQPLRPCRAVAQALEDTPWWMMAAGKRQSRFPTMSTVYSSATASF